MSNFVLSDEEQQAVEEGEAARLLLESPVFLKAIEAVRAQCAEQILTSDPAAKLAREDLYNLSRGLTAVVVELGALTARADTVLLAAEAQSSDDDHQDDVITGDY